jgi:hypothetical protein
MLPQASVERICLSGVMVILTCLVSFFAVGSGSHFTAYAQAAHQAIPNYSCGDAHTPPGHCYAYMDWPGGPQGEKVDITAQGIGCGNACSSNGEINTEMWDVDATASNWVEIGLRIGYDAGAPIAFWADSRPGGGYHIHYHNALGAGEFHHHITFYIYTSGANTWGVQKATAGVDGCSSSCSPNWTEFSTNNSMSPHDIQIGTELAGGPSGASEPVTDFTWNYWLNNQRQWIAQGFPNGGGTGVHQIPSSGPPFAGWVDEGGPNGGDFQTWCC